MDDRELVDAVIGGDESAFAEFLGRFGKLIYYVARRKFRFSQEDSDDFLQKVCIALLEDGCRRLRAWRGEGNFAHYLTPIVNHMAINSIEATRNQPRQFGEEEEDLLGPDPDPTPEQSVQLAQMRELLRDCYERLTERARELIRLRHWEGHSQSQLAQALDINISAAGVALLRAERQLRDCLSRKIGDRPWALS